MLGRQAVSGSREENEVALSGRSQLLGEDFQRMQCLPLGQVFNLMTARCARRDHGRFRRRCECRQKR